VRPEGLGKFKKITSSGIEHATFRKFKVEKDMEKLRIDRNRLREWAFGNEMIINPTKSKAGCFTRARMTENIPL
jgi:hypothetical protein